MEKIVKGEAIAPFLFNDIWYSCFHCVFHFFCEHLKEASKVKRGEEVQEGTSYRCKGKHRTLTFADEIFERGNSLSNW